ncbi:MAG: ABC transporter permease [Pseudohongiella sp.]|nr:ABC transporter permease [Pseudohongiella sp.]
MKKLINFQPSRALKTALGIIPFLLVLLVYQVGSDIRKAENEQDKLLPSFAEIAAAIDRMAFEPSRRTGEYLFWKDTKSSVVRLAKGISIAAAIGLIVGLMAGSIPIIAAPLNPLITAISLIPPLAILPVLFIVFGLGELSKVMLIVIGVSPFLVRDILQRTQELPREQLVKAQTLGGNSWQIILRVILPQILPRLIDAVRLSLGAAWLFLIAAEAIASTDGLGYRIFLVRRYMSMDVILPYVVWITFLAFATDLCLLKLSRIVFPWYHADK